MSGIVRAYGDWYLTLSEMGIWGVAFGFVVLGGVVAALVHKGRLVLLRAPYYAGFGAIMLGIMLGQLIWLQGGRAIAEGWAGWLVLAETGLNLIWGYLFVMLGQARSRDAFGHGAGGILALVPVANLWLLFAPSRDASLAAKVSPVLRGRAGVVVGLVLMVASRVLEPVIVGMIETATVQAASSPENGAPFIEMSLRQMGLEGTLQAISDQAALPEDLGDGFTLTAISAEGRVLAYRYDLSGPAAEAGPPLAADVIGLACTDPVIGALLAAGATIRFDYTAGGAALGSIPLTPADCAV